MLFAGDPAERKHKSDYGPMFFSLLSLLLTRTIGAQQIRNEIPGFPQLHAIKFCTMTIFCLRDKLNPMTFASLSQGLRRDTAPLLLSMFIYREKDSAVYQTCTPDDASHVRTFGAIAPAPNKNYTMTAKSAPYLPCTVTTLWPRWRGVPGPCPDAATGNTNYSYHRAVSTNI